MPLPPHRICFVSYEIHPTTRGGCGVLLYNSARVLLAAGHTVIFLLDISGEEFNRFKNEDRLKLPNAENCLAFQVEALCADIDLQAEDFGTEIEWRAYRFYYAAKRVDALAKPELMEFFDYCGVGYHATAAKAAGMAFADCRLVIRLHNPLEIIDAHEGTATLDKARYMLYGLEHAALRKAETVLYPSQAYLDKAVAPFYEPWFGEAVHSKPALTDFPAMAAAGEGAKTVLFYGRLFGFKGVDILIDAAVTYLADAGNPRLNFTLVGYDSCQPPVGTGTYRDYLMLKVPGELREFFTFTDFLTWAQLGDLGPRVRMAVFPNYFESFCYAAHELYAAGVPLIVSDTPAFEDYFKHGKNALVFDGSTRQLAEQIKQLATDDALAGRLRRPWAINDEPLSGFYDRALAASWILPGGPREAVRSLVCVLADGSEERLAATLGTVPGDCAVVVLHAADGRKGDGDLGNGGAVIWWLGRLFRAVDRDGGALGVGAMTSVESLLILRAGDELGAEFLPRAQGILRRQKEIGFVSCWSVEANGTGAKKNTFPLDAAVELTPFGLAKLQNRALMRTAAGKALIDLFDPRARELGEIDYLWKLEGDAAAGLTIPEVMMKTFAGPVQAVNPKTLSYLILRNLWSVRQRRLAKYLMTEMGQPAVQKVAAIPAVAAAMAVPAVTASVQTPEPFAGVNGRMLVKEALRRLKLKVLGNGKH